ncbi:MAG: hypothetical protein AB1405_11370, partial [Bdellovibrionota bacterium]
MRRAFLFLLLFPSLVLAAPPTKDELPPALRPWSAWVLHGREGETCPFLQDQGGMRCGWAGRLELNLSESGGTFSQEWTLFARNFVQLPGSERHWPVDVRMNGVPAAVVSREGIPHLDLEAGIYRVTGTFLWNKLPESLAVPLQTGIVSLRVRGAPVPFPTRSESGALWLRGAAAQAGEADALEIMAHRRVIDEVPLRVLTHLELRVSGKSREELLGKILLEKFIPLSLSSPLPARIEPDGRLRVQVRPGVWHLWLEARHVDPVSEIPLSDPGTPWAAEEVWVFDARPDLRVVDVEGPQAIDPQQTTLPEDWKDLPSYRVTSGETMKFAERRRGNADPAPDRLTLKRDLWLDFGGTGYTVRDQMGGALSRSWRLEMGEGQVLERAVLGGEDQVITTREGFDLRGFEIRQGTVDLSAESRIEHKVSSLPAVGWAHDFQEVSATLHLPPGWRIVSALGVDEVPGTWTRRWTLLDFFLVLIAALAFRKLWGTRWGALALAGLVLSYHEPGVPKWAWLWVLGAEALLRLLKESRFRRLVSAARIGLAGVLLVFLIPFSVQQIRQAMYPVLEYPDWEVGGDRMRRESFLEGMVMPHERKAKEAEVYDEMVQEEMPAAAPEAPAPQALQALGGAALSADVSEFSKGRVRGYKSATAILQQIDPKAVVSTGPGLPAWEWNQIELKWSGTVEKDHRIRLFLVSPPVNFFLAWVRVILLSLLALCVIGLPSDVWPEKWRKWFVPAGTAAGLFLLLSVTPARAQGEDSVPRQEILDQLRERLLEKQPCYPKCAEVSRLFVEVSETSLRLRLEVHAQAPLAVPLPGSTGQWLPAQVFVDGIPSRTLLGAPGGILWLEISKGRHDVVLEGPLPERESLQITLPLEPRLAGARASGWRVDGIDEEGRVQGSLSLTRTARSSGAKQKGFEPEALPSFVRV